MHKPPYGKSVLPEEKVCTDNQWKSLGGNSQHLGVYGSWIAFGLANCRLRKSDEIPMFVLVKDSDDCDSELDDNTVPVLVTSIRPSPESEHADVSVPSAPAWSIEFQDTQDSL